MNLVVGATGLLGSEICQLLVTEGKAVRGSREVQPRTGRRWKDFKASALEIVRGDLKDRSSLNVACARHQNGYFDRLRDALTTGGRLDPERRPRGDNSGSSTRAKAAGVERFVLVSFPNMNVEFPLQTAKREVEQHLKGKRDDVHHLAAVILHGSVAESGVRFRRR